ncbi:MAG TPA: CDP-glycerol glycerophosphotransferase family protein [bacterium]|nr:CDP-glycerol glycerophosphotransferase family protein [bacterium]
MRKDRFTLNILFDVYYLYFWPHFAPIWQQFQTLRNSVSGFATFTTEDHPEALQLSRQVLEQAGLTLLTGRNEKERLAALKEHTYDLTFVGGIRPGFDVIRNQSRVVCAMSHGLGIKQAYFTDSPEGADLRFTEGPQHHAALKARYPDLNIELVGMSKLDPLVQSDRRRFDAYLNRYGLSKDRPIILWAPTFYPSSLEVLAKPVRRIAPKTEYQWILKPHHFTMFPRRWKYKRQYKLVHRLAKNIPNLTLLPPHEYSIIPWLNISDVLISDTSSTVFEMIAADKPVIQCTKYKKRWNHYLFPSRLYTKRLDTETTEQLEYAVRIDSPEDLESAVERGLQDPEWLREKRRTAREQLFFQLDGKASLRIVQNALSLLNAADTRAAGD